MSLIARLIGAGLIFSAIMFWQKGAETVLTFWTSAATGLVTLVLAVSFITFVLWTFGAVTLNKSVGAICTICAIIVGFFGLDDIYKIFDGAWRSMMIGDIFFYGFAALLVLLLLEHVVRHRDDIKEYAKHRRGTD